jgi:EAL and modified HD-GYP domain-containing signal transduction protein
MGSSYIGRQPIVDAKGKVFAYDLLYTKPATETVEHATAILINNLQSAFGIDPILGKRLGFIRVDRDVIVHGLIDLLPKNRIVFALLETSIVDEPLRESLAQYTAQGYRFALNDLPLTLGNIEKFSPIFSYLSYIKVDTTYSESLMGESYQRIHNLGIPLIGAKIESHDMHAACVVQGFIYFEGFFISKPKVLENPSFSLDPMEVMRLWNMLQADESIDVLVEAFEKNHMVSLKLIRFINSAIFSLRNPVSSIRHVLTLMGREPLARWVMLLMYSEAQNLDRNTIPLLLMVVERTELMTQLLELTTPVPSKKQLSTAYFVGMLSLIHLLFQIPHRELLHRLNVAPEIERALFEGDGFYGEFLTMVRAIEMFDVEAIDQFLEKHAISYEQFEPIIAQAREKVNQFDEAMG